MGRHVFDRMQSRNIFTWTAMVTGYAQEGDSEEAGSLFFTMLREGVKPDKVMYMSLLNAFQNHEKLDLGKEVHSHAIDAGVVADVRVGNALISMYARCGSMEDALQVFNDMPKRENSCFVVYHFRPKLPAPLNYQITQQHNIATHNHLMYDGNIHFDNE